MNLAESCRLPCLEGGGFQWDKCALGQTGCSLRLVVEQLQRQALVDSLTGAFNGHYFNKRLPEEMIRAERYEHSMCLVMADLCFMGLVNNKYGHLMGDQYLIAAVTALKTRPTDLAFRLSGGADEFYKIVPETNLRDCLTLMNRVILTFSHPDFLRQFISLNKNLFELKEMLGLSVGIVEYNPNNFPSHLTQEQLMELVDQAMYRAKNGDNGERVRNRIAYFDNRDGEIKIYNPLQNPA